MTSTRPLATLWTVLALTAAPTPALSQRVLGPGEDAVTIPRGTLRSTLFSDNLLQSTRWNQGQSEALGVGLSGDLGVGRLSALSALDGALGLIGGGSSPTTLGRLDSDLRQRLAVTTLGLEYGATDWLTVSVRAPFVRARAEAQVRLDASAATAGMNPTRYASGVLSGNAATFVQYAAAADGLAQRRDDCVGDSGSHAECGDILAELSAVNSLMALMNTFRSSSESVYGSQGGSPGSVFVPLAGSDREEQLRARVDSFHAAFTRYGIGALDGVGLPLGAQFPLTAGQLDTLFSDSTYGFAGRLPPRSARQDLGDVDVGVRIKLFDSFRDEPARFAAARVGLRQTVALAYRLGGGAYDDPDNFIDLGTGSGHDAWGARSLTDVVLSDRWWATFTVGVARGMAHERVSRVPVAPDDGFASRLSSTTVRIEPAMVIEVGAAPRLQLNDYFAFGLHYRWRSQGEDRITNTQSAGNDRVRVLEVASAHDEQRLAWNITYSTLAAFARGHARLPVEVAYDYDQSVASAGGVLPRQRRDRVHVRIYTRLFGR